jgi:hypothetical protein
MTVSESVAVSGTPGKSVRYLTTVEVADLLRAKAETVRYWRQMGQGPKSFKVGRRVLYAIDDVEAFIADARGASGAACGASGAA